MGRFDNLKGSSEKNKESNPFKKGGRRKEKNEKIRDFSKMKGTMPLPGLNNDSSENKSGKYVAPGLRNKYRSRNNTPKEKAVFKTEDKFREKEGDFPELASVNFPELQVKKENKNVVDEKVDEEKSSKWSNIVSEKDDVDDDKQGRKYTKEEYRKLLKKCEPVRPGWVRLSLDKETRKVTYEYGPETKEHLEFMARMERSRLEQARKAWDTRMREIEEFNEMMYPEDNYIYSWEYDDHVHHQEWLRKLEEDDYGEQFYESEGSDEYYSDEY